MMFIIDLLNKIKWDKREDPSEYKIVYYDRVEDKNKEVKFDKIKEIENLFITVELDDKEISLPMHRIREVKKGDKIVWKREPGKESNSEESIYLKS